MHVIFSTCGPVSCLVLEHRKVSIFSWKTWGCRHDLERGYRPSYCPCPFVEVERVILGAVDGVVVVCFSCEDTSQSSVSRSRPRTTDVLGPYPLSLAPECITLLAIQLDTGSLLQSGSWCLQSSPPRRLSA